MNAHYRAKVIVIINVPIMKVDITVLAFLDIDSEMTTKAVKVQKWPLTTINNN